MVRGGKYYVYFKSGYRQNHTTVFGLATADTLAGPYTLRPEPVLVPPRGAQTVFEDAQVFQENGTVYVLTTDNYGTLTGVRAGLALWKSADGVHFSPDDIELAAYLFPRYLPHYDPARTKQVYGGLPSPQRPKVLMRGGGPAYLYAASGWVYDGTASVLCPMLDLSFRCITLCGNIVVGSVCWPSNPRDSRVIQARCESHVFRIARANTV